MNQALSSKSTIASTAAIGAAVLVAASLPARPAEASFTNNFPPPSNDLSTPVPSSFPAASNFEVSFQSTPAASIKSASKPSKSLGEIVNEKIGFSANIADLLAVATGAIGALLAWRSYLRNPKTIHTESVFLRGSSKPGFINAGTRKISEIYDEYLDRRVIHRAARQATPQFPMLHIDPRRFSRILNALRDDLSAIDADTGISALGLPKEASSFIRDWHLIVFARVSCFRGERPVIMRDFFTFTSMVEMLERPLALSAGFRGIKRQHLIHHLEEAALVAHLQPTVLKRAIREAYPEKASKSAEHQAWIDHRANRLTENAQALLRLLTIGTDKSLEALSEAERANSLEPLHRRATDEQIDDVIAQRMKSGRLRDGIDSFLYKAKLGPQWRAEPALNPSEIGLYDFFTVSNMTTVDVHGLGQRCP